MSNYDEVLEQIVGYVEQYDCQSAETLDTAKACLADSLGCAILALRFKECSKLLGPVVPDTQLPYGTHVPGTSFVLDPIRGAFNIGLMIRWLDYNDTWLAQEWGHPSDNLGALLAVADYQTRKNLHERKKPLTVGFLLQQMIKAYEIQGVIALENSFNRAGFDHVILVKAASAVTSAQLLGANRSQLLSALSNAFVDAGPLRTYRHAPNTGSRKSWAAGDATSRGVNFALLALAGEMGYPSALTAPVWGLNAVVLKGKPLTLARPLGTYVMDNILFKVSFPAEFHAQTAVEAAIQLHPAVKGRLNEIRSIRIDTHESALRIIAKEGPLHNPADRDHCLQYMIAIGLIHGDLTADHYEAEAAADPRIDQLRTLMQVHEDKTYSQDYLDPEKRSIANRLTIEFKDGSSLKPVAVEYPIGHQRRRKEALPLIYQKCAANLATHYPQEVVARIMDFLKSPDLEHHAVNQLTDLF